MSITIGSFTVEATSIGQTGQHRFTGHWSIYRIPWNPGDLAIMEGDTPVFEDSRSALVRAENNGAAEARRLAAAEASML